MRGKDKTFFSRQHRKKQKMFFLPGLFFVFLIFLEHRLFGSSDVMAPRFSSSTISTNVPRRKKFKLLFHEECYVALVTTCKKTNFFQWLQCVLNMHYGLRSCFLPNTTPTHTRNSINSHIFKTYFVEYHTFVSMYVIKRNGGQVTALNELAKM